MGEARAGNRSNILITSISRKVPLIKAVREAKSRLTNYGLIYGADITEQCVGRYFVDVFWKIPPTEKLRIDRFIKYCLKNKIHCIIPTRDGELPFFSKYKNEFGEQGINVMTSDYTAVGNCLDKYSFFKESCKLGFPIIKTVLNIDELLCGSYVVKERYGSGSQNILLNIDRNRALIHASKLKNSVFQPYVCGEEMSVDLYIDINGKTKGTVARVREFVINGESQITVTCKENALEDLCSDMVQKLKLFGHVVVQAIIDDSKQVHIIECNPRFGGASTLSLRVGLDSFYWFLLETMGKDISRYPFVRSNEEKRQVRYPEDLVISDGTGF